jgi:tyrosine-protein kinase Etk/Wzc
MNTSQVQLSPLSTRTDSGDREISTFDFLHNFSTYKWFFASIVSAFTGLALAYLLLASPVYKANVLIQVDQQQTSALGALSDVASALSLTKSLDGELDILNSRAVFLKAIDATQANTDVSVNNRIPVLGKLYARFATPYSGLADSPFGLDEFAWGGEKLSLKKFVVPPQMYGKSFYVVLDSIGTWHLEDSSGTVLARGKTGVLTPFDTHTTGAVGHGVIQIEELIGRPHTRFELVQSSVQSAVENLRKQLKVAETTHDSSMIELSFKAGDPSVAAHFANALSNAYVALNVKHLSEQARLSLRFLNGKLPAFKRDLEQSEDLLNKYRVTTKTIDIEQQTESLLERSADLIKQKTLVDLNLQATRQQFSDTHPSVRALEQQSSALDRASESVLKQIETLPSTQQDYLRLARDVTVNTQLYTALLSNAQQLEVAEAGTTGNASVIDAAVVPEKQDWPRAPIVIGGALVGGALIGLIVVQLAGAVHGALRDPLQIERVSSVPIFAVVPESRKQTVLARSAKLAQHPIALLAVSDPSDPSIEALRSLRSTLKFALVDKSSNVVLFTGPTPGVGKTFTAANFAHLLALNGERVLLIDADMRRSGLDGWIVGPRQGGLAEVLADVVPLKDAIIWGEVENLWLLPSSVAAPPNPSELLERPRFKDMLKQVSEKYDFVIIDSPPVLPVSDALTIAQLCSAVFMIVRCDMTSERQLTEALSRLGRAHVTVAGLIFNGFRTGGLSYGYQYGYGYSSVHPNKAA